jgi:tape measure domain-containing protein
MSDPQVTLRIKADGADASAKLGQVTTGLRALGAAGQTSDVGLNVTRQGVQGVSTALNEAKGHIYGFLAAHIGLQNATKTLSSASDYGRLVAGLNLVEGSAKAGAAALQEIQGIAKRQGADLDAIGETYQRIARSVKLFGGDSADAAKMTETVSAALRLNNASAAEASAVMRQFSQAMGKGKVNGDEFMSLMENAPTLMDAVAKSLGKTKAELYAMSEAGTLTSDVFGGAVLGSFATMTAQAAKLPKTFDQSSVAMKNAFMTAAGESRQVGAALSAVNGAMGLLAENAQAVLGVAVVVGAGAASYGILRLAAAGQAAVSSLVANRAATLASLQAEVVRTEVLVAQTAAQAANTGVTTAHTAALAAQAAAQNALAVATSRGAVVMAALGGPIGVVTGLLALGAAAWSFYADSAADGAAKASKESKPSFDELIQGVDVQIEMLKKRNALAAKGIKFEDLRSILNQHLTLGHKTGLLDYWPKANADLEW